MEKNFHLQVCKHLCNDLLAECSKIVGLAASSKNGCWDLEQAGILGSFIKLKVLNAHAGVSLTINVKACGLACGDSVVELEGITSNAVNPVVHFLVRNDGLSNVGEVLEVWPGRNR